MNLAFDLFQAERRGDILTLRDLEGRVILRSSFEPFDWGRESTLQDRSRLAATLLFHAGIGDSGPAAEALATAILLGLPRHGWTMTSYQVHEWYADYIKRGGVSGEVRNRKRGRRDSRD